MKIYYHVLAAVAALFLAGCCCNCFTGCEGPRIKGSGVSATEQREVTQFDAVETRIGSDMEIRRGDQPTLSITADDNLLPIITTEVRNGTLVVSSEERYSTRNRVRLVIEVPVISRVDIKGSSDVRLESVTDEKLEIGIAGSGDVEAVGEVRSLDVRISGSGDLKLKQLQSQDCQIRINGSGDAELFVVDSLDARIAGSGDIAYYGNPAHVQAKVSGSGTITKGN